MDPFIRVASQRQLVGDNYQWGTFGRYCYFSGILCKRLMVKATQIAGNTAYCIWYMSTDPDIHYVFKRLVFKNVQHPADYHAVRSQETAVPIRNFHEAENAYKRVRRNVPGAYHMTPEPESEDQDRRRKIPQTKLPRNEAGTSLSTQHSDPPSPTPDIQGAKDAFLGVPWKLPPPLPVSSRFQFNNSLTNPHTGFNPFKNLNLFKPKAAQSAANSTQVTPDHRGQPTVFRVPDPTPSTGSTLTTSPLKDPAAPSHTCKHCGCHNSNKSDAKPPPPSPLEYRDVKSRVATPYARSRLSLTSQNRYDAQGSAGKYTPHRPFKTSLFDRQKFYANYYCFGSGQHNHQNKPIALPSAGQATLRNKKGSFDLLGKSKRISLLPPYAALKRKLAPDESPLYNLSNPVGHPRRKSRSPPPGSICPKGNSKYSHDANLDTLRVASPVYHSANSSQSRKSILKRPGSSGSFGINFTALESGAVPVISVEDEEDPVEDMSFLPEASPENQPAKVRIQNSYQFGLTEPRPKVFNEEEAMDFPVNRPSDEDLFMKMQDHHLTECPESPMSPGLDESLIKLPPPEDTPEKSVADYPALHNKLIRDMVPKGEQKLSHRRVVDKIDKFLSSVRESNLSSVDQHEASQEEAELSDELYDELFGKLSDDLSGPPSDELSEREEEKLEEEEQNEIERIRMHREYAEVANERAHNEAMKIIAKRNEQQEIALAEKRERRASKASQVSAGSKQTLEDEKQAGLEADAVIRDKPLERFVVRPLNQATYDEVKRLQADYDDRQKSGDRSISTTKVREDSQVTYRELETIFGSLGWLNDEVVNEFIGCAIDEELQNVGFEKSATSGPPPIHAFNSAMWTTYKNRGTESLKRWFKRAKLDGPDLLKADAVFVPINTGGHWVLLVIFGTVRKVAVLDSMAGIPPRINEQYTDFAYDLIEKVLGEHYDAGEWKQSHHYSMQQHNGSDCGVFVCLNALALIRYLDPKKAIGGGHFEMEAARFMIAGVLVRGSMEAAGVGFE